MKILNQSIKIIQIAHKHATKEKGLFCPECGDPLYGFEVHETYVCSYCHFFIDKNDNFCYKCGIDIKKIGAIRYWCNNNSLDKEEFTNLIDALKISKEEVK